MTFPSDDPPAAEPDPVTPEPRPAVVGLLRSVIFVLAALLLLWGTGALSMAPLPSVITIVETAIALVALRIAYQGLGRGQRWAVQYAVALLLVALVSGLWQMVDPATPPAPPDSVTIPLGSILAAIVLLRVWSSRSALAALIAASPPAGSAVRLILLASLAAPLVLSGIATRVTDPTQTTGRDLFLELAVTCGPDAAAPGLLVVTATATITWARHDVLPGGILGALERPRDHDAMLVQAVWNGGASAGSDSPGGWALEALPIGQPWLEPGVSVPVPGPVTLAGGAPNDLASETFPEAASPNVPVSFVPERMTTGQPYRATWTFAQAPPIPWPLVRARYVHESRFAADASAGCGETSSWRE